MYKLKGDLQLLKALSFADAGMASSSTRSVQKDLYRQLEDRIKVIEDAVVSPSYPCSTVGNNAGEDRHDYARQRSVQNCTEADYQMQKQPSSEENETLRDRLADIRSKPSYPDTPKDDGSRHLMNEEIETAMSNLLNINGSPHQPLSGSVASVPRPPPQSQQLRSNCSPGVKFVAELSSLIDLDAGHHAALADIMDRKMR